MDAFDAGKGDVGGIGHMLTRGQRADREIVEDLTSELAVLDRAVVVATCTTTLGRSTSHVSVK
ncbi:hypothetical protein [Streptomyces blastmyceticus]|uniref:Uncharacterized protein n=1 Tax=Streptomyces blastmyceticus TaxID=68180 RepID=A0ABN0XN19_9ACTN